MPQQMGAKRPIKVARWTEEFDAENITRHLLFTPLIGALSEMGRQSYAKGISGVNRF